MHYWFLHLNTYILLHTLDLFYFNIYNVRLELLAKWYFFILVGYCFKTNTQEKKKLLRSVHFDF